MKYTLENLAKLKAEAEKTKQDILAEINQNNIAISSLENDLVEASSDREKFEKLYFEKVRLEKRNEANKKQLEYLRPYSLDNVMSGCQSSIDVFNKDIAALLDNYLKKREEAYKLYIELFDVYNEAQKIRFSYKEFLPEENKQGLNARDIGLLKQIKIHRIPDHAASFENIEYGPYDKGTISSSIECDSSNDEFNKQEFLCKSKLDI